MNLDQIISDVRTVVRDSPGTWITDADIVRWANHAQLDLAARLGLLDEQWTETDGAIAAGSFPLPWNVIEITRLRITGDDEDVVFTDDDVFQSHTDAESALDYRLGRIFEERVELYPQPANGTAYTLRGKRRPARLVLGETEAPKTLTVATAAAEIATFTTPAAHGYAVGNWVDVAGVTPATYNGTWQIATVPSTTTFTAHIGSTPAAGSAFGTVERTDVPEIAEELHLKIVAYARWQAKIKSSDLAESREYGAQYLEGLPSAPTARARTMPGPLQLVPFPGTFDDEDSMHI